jgi:hypothetical protein
MHDWSKRDARRAAMERHQRSLRTHSGYPMSDGHSLRVLCACGARCPTVAEWEAHLTAAIESLIQH